MLRDMKGSGAEWIGDIPSTWKVCDLKRTCSIKTGNTPSKADGNQNFSDIDGLPWIKAENLDSFYPIHKTNEYLTKAGENLARIFPPFTVFVCCIASVGKVGFSDIRISCNQQINGLTFDENKIFWKYGYYAMKAAADEHIAKANVSVQMIINSSQESYIKIPIPSLGEQMEIVSFIDNKCSKIDEAISRHESIIKKLEDYRKVIIKKSVTRGLNPDVVHKNTNNTYFEQIPAHWDLRRNKYIFRIKKDIAGQEGLTVLSITQNGIVPKNIESNEGQIAASYKNYQLVNTGDFAMNHMDLLTGWVDISKYNGVTSPDYRVFVFREPELHNAQYFLYIMQMCYFEKIFYGLGAGVSGLGRWRLQAPVFNDFKIPVPPKDEQDKIVDYLDAKCSKIDEAISRQKEAIAKLQEYRKSIIYHAVTGKIDCRKEVS